MATAERGRAGGRELGRAVAWGALAAILLGGLGLRLWGVRQGLPFAYNTDEADHFVPHAVAMFQHGTLDPHYFANPPGFTYVLHFLFGIWFGGGAGVVRTFALHPDRLYTLARVVAALFGTGALWLLYGAAARLIGRGPALLATAIAAVAFLPVFYAHLALNDVPTLLPLTLSLYGSAGVLRSGRARDHAIAGIGLGFACAFKYTAGVIVLPYLAALTASYLGGGTDALRPAARGLVIAGVCALAAFLLANPYALLDYHSFRAELAHQSSLSAESQGKLGAPRNGGLVYYLWSLTWGLGWLPALAALGGAVTVWQRRPPGGPQLGWMLVPAPVLFLLFMGLQGRYFGRWLMPILPILCVLAAVFAARCSQLLSGAASSGRRVLLARGLAAGLVLALLAQGLVYSIHGGLVLSRSDTRAIARRWMLAHIPAGAPIVAEPISPNEWANEARAGTSTATNRPLWNKYPSLIPRVDAAGALLAHAGRQVTIEDYERTLAPALIGYYEQHGYCWVLTGSTQSGRAAADPGGVPQAVAYYRTLAARGRVVFRASPYRHGRGPVGFNFDWSFDYYPLAYERPGPLVTIYRLAGGRCGSP